MKKLIANLFNPHEQTKEQLIKSFVVRLNVFKKLFREIKSCDMKYPEQHILIVGQRGMGKTTLLLRLSYEVENDNELNTWLIPIILKEEAYYGIRRLFKLWETIAQELENTDSTFSGLFDYMGEAYNENTDYERICFDILINALEICSKKIILFIDNLGEMFQNFTDMECHRLREVLMTCPCLRIVGASTVVLEAFFEYRHAFYEFFKKEQLNVLKRGETHQLLLELAKNFKEEKKIQAIIENQPGRVETLRIMTGGVIRSIVLLFEIFIDHKEGNSISDLDNILDRVTPLYQYRMKELTSLQQAVVNAIALNWDAISIEEIVVNIRMKTTEIEPVLSELEKVNIIQRVATDTRLNLYHLKERFFNIWYLMRLAPRGSRAKVIWLVRFLECWYDEHGLVQRAKIHIDAISKGSYHPKAAYYLTEALARTCKLDMDTEHQMIVETKKLLEKKDKSLVADLSQSDKELFEESKKYYSDDKYEKAESTLLRIKNKNKGVYFELGILYHIYLKEFDKAEKYYLMAVDKDNAGAMYNLGLLYHVDLKEFDKAEKYYLMAVDNGDTDAMFNLGYFYKNNLKDFEKAEKYYLMAADKDHAGAMSNLGLLYNELKDIEKAEKYYLMAADKGHEEAMYSLGFLYFNELKEFEKAEKYYLMAADKGHEEAMYSLGFLYFNELKEFEKAEKYYLMAADNGDSKAMNNLGWLYHTESIDYEKA
ncbi:MAG: sel1 repeat family protein, partial [Desulfobacterales bacterium]|nr:sel1 repeat family protein [Desulfobacterales bacterium]